MKIKILIRTAFLLTLIGWGVFLKITLVNKDSTENFLTTLNTYRKPQFTNTDSTTKFKIKIEAELDQKSSEQLERLISTKHQKPKIPLDSETEYEKRVNQITEKCRKFPNFHKCYKIGIIKTENMLNSLNNKEKIKQLLAPAYSYDLMKSSTPEEGYGAYVLIKTRAYKNSEQISKDIEKKLLVNDGIETEKIPPFIGVDAEGGIIQRFSWYNLNHLSKLKNKSKTEMNKTLYSDMQTIKNSGFNWSLAPVVDLPYGKNDWIYNRTISTKKEEITKTSSNYIQYMHDNGILTTLKHYPGHGDSQTDSHYNTPIINHSKSVWNKNEGEIYKNIISKNSNLTVMTGHVKYPKIDEDITSISEKWQTEILRDDLEFKGLVITDDITMLSTATDRSCYELTWEAIKSGADIVIFVESSKCKGDTMVEILMDKYESSDANKQILNDRVGRILDFKGSWF